MLGRGPERRYNHHSCARSTTKLMEYLYNCRVEALKGNETVIVVHVLHVQQNLQNISILIVMLARGP